MDKLSSSMEMLEESLSEAENKYRNYPIWIQRK
jgi:hypothetical protein